MCAKTQHWCSLTILLQSPWSTGTRGSLEDRCRCYREKGRCDTLHDITWLLHSHWLKLRLQMWSLVRLWSQLWLVQQLHCDDPAVLLSDMKDVFILLWLLTNKTFVLILMTEVQVAGVRSEALKPSTGPMLHFRLYLRENARGGRVNVGTCWLCESKQAFPAIKQQQRRSDFTPRPWVMDHFRKESQPGEHIVSQLPLLFKMSRQQRDQSSGIGLDWVCPWFLMIREAGTVWGNGQCSWSATLAVNSSTLRTGRAQYSTKPLWERERHWATGTAKETAETLSPPNPQLCRESSSRGAQKHSWL